MCMGCPPVRALREREHGEARYGPSWRRIVRDYSSGYLRLDAHALRVPLPPMPKSMGKKILRDESPGSSAICVTEPRCPDYRCATREVPLRWSRGVDLGRLRRLRSCRRSIRLGGTPDLGASQSRARCVWTLGAMPETPRWKARWERPNSRYQEPRATQISTDRIELVYQTDGTSTARANETQGPAAPKAIRIRVRPHT